MEKNQSQQQSNFVEVEIDDPRYKGVIIRITLEMNDVIDEGLELILVRDIIFIPPFLNEEVLVEDEEFGKVVHKIVSNIGNTLMEKLQYNNNQESKDEPNSNRNSNPQESNPKRGIFKKSFAFLTGGLFQRAQRTSSL